eukprot:GILK01011566.1.p1 GENE.GILK01011566.1~~GILK01011566.1.p1  ORF type:complete len:180 (-),score=21.62 GILK01011566.1:280-786(-)
MTEPDNVFFRDSRRKQTEDSSSSLSSAEYLERHNLSLYLNDVVSILLQQRTEQPLQILNEYFAHVVKGNHVIQRDFAFVNANEWNRKSFIQVMKKATEKSFQDQDGTVDDCHQLLGMFCPDFPFALVHEAARTLRASEASTTEQSTKYKLVDLLAAVYKLFDVADTKR